MYFRGFCVLARAKRVGLAIYHVGRVRAQYTFIFLHRNVDSSSQQAYDSFKDVREIRYLKLSSANVLKSSKLQGICTWFVGSIQHNSSQVSQLQSPFQTYISFSFYERVYSIL
ncbi:hypothetical protein DFH06DRAFT_1171544 [Mycena polygramma]|nr:hypothetical protein DFH06DRAFT_1171544 [Mycena polygramma]